MKRQETRAFLSLGMVLTRVRRPASPLAALLVLLMVLSGCQTSRVAPQIRPHTSTDRLVKNADYLKKSGRVELAVKELEEAHLQDPGDLTIVDVLIRCYEDLGHFDRAQELYEEALSRVGRHPALENNRCYSFYLQGRLSQAEACFRKVLARHPDHQTARNNLGLVLCGQGREAEALALWREAGSEAEARERLRQALSALGREAPAPLAAGASLASPQESVSAGKPADRQTAAAGKPAESSGPETSEPRAPRSAQPESPPAAPAAAPAPPAATLTQPGATRPKPTPEPVAALRPDPQTQPQTEVVASKAGKGPSSAAAGTSTVKEAVDSTPILTALDMLETKIELKNGNGFQDCAREMRSRLSRDGFNVVGIGNHIDFGLEETIIAYRPQAARVAQVLAQKFFPEARLKANGKISPKADIRVSLGRDWIADKGQLARISP